jgi:hypothetical protein
MRYFLKHCWKCRSRLLKERHPHTYVLNQIRHSARKRKLPFTITLEQFRQFCTETRYLELKGKLPNSMTIDRIDWNDGYHIGNIRLLTHAENCAEGGDNRTRGERGAAVVDDDNEPF